MTIPDEIKRLTGLKELYLQYNNLTSLAPGLGRLSSLKWLRLNNNRLDTLPITMLQLPLDRFVFSMHNNWFRGKEEQGKLIKFLIY